MSKHIFEEGPRRGHAAGDTSIEQQASQLASDIKYKARQKMKGSSGSDLSPGQVQALYRQLLNSSPAPGAVKSIAKKKLFGEQIDRGEKLVSQILEDCKSKAFERIFEEKDEKKFVVRVTDRATGNTSYRKADRAKIAELRANKNISSVEITGRKEADDAYGEKHEKKYGPAKGKNTVGDKDGDGTKEPDRHEYAGVKDRAIKKAMAKEEVIYEKEETGEKKLDVMKGKNTIKVNPTIGESIRAELDALKAQKIEEQESVMKQQDDEKKKEQLAKQQASKDKQMKMRILQNKMRAVRSGAEISASHQLEGDTLSESAVRYCPKCDKDETREECKYGGEYWDENSKPAKAEDPREEPTKASLFKNKLRARGIKVAGLSIAPRNMKTYDDLGEEASDRARDEHQMRGGMAARKDYDRPPAKKLSNKELGIKPGKTWVQKQMEKKSGIYNSYEAEGEMTEEASDRAKDEHLMRGGMAARQDYDRAPKAPNTKKFGTGKTALQKDMEKKYGKGASAMDIVKAEIRAKHGKGAIMNTKKK